MLRDFGFGSKWPSTHATHIERRHLRDLKSGKYVVCDKSDGVRCLLVLHSKATFLTDRAYKAALLRTTSKPTPPGTILDGELVIVKGGHKLFLAYDALVYRNENICDRPLEDRLYVATEAINGLNLTFEDGVSLFLTVKKMVPVSEIEAFLEEMKSLPYPTDGIVLTPSTEPLQPGTSDRLLKWKDRVTVDFMVARGSERGTYDLHIKNNSGGMEHIVTLKNLRGLDSLQMQIFTESEQCIVECYYDRSKGTWRPLRLRADKLHPNSMFVYKNSVKNIKEDITIDEICEQFRS